MSRKLRSLIFVMFVVTALFAANSVNVAFGQPHDSLQVANLMAEYATNPLGIDVTKPRLSWQLQSDERGQYQTAYRIQVASSESNLLAGIADIWDTGKIDSDESVNVEYGGKPLESRMRYHWRVKVWDKHGNESAWSDPAWWEMGLLDDADWQAEWIGFRVDTQDEINLDGAHWIWYPEGNPAVDAPVGVVYFRYAFQAPPVEQLTKAEMLLSADDVYLLYVNGVMADVSPQETDAWKQARWVDLLPYLRTGQNAIAIIAMNGAPTGSRNPAGLIASLRIEHESGISGVFRTNGEWKTSKTIETGWQEPGFDDSSWTNAMEVAVFGEPPWGTQVQRPTFEPAPLIRNEFTVDKAVKQARVYISGLAYYNLYLNGEKVGDRVLDPAFTDYNDRVMYVTHDVTEYIHQGANAIGVELGRGFYGMLSPNVWNWHLAPWHDDPKLLLQLEIEYEDGTIQRVVSDETWRATEGPTLYDSLYGGETYDARREKPGWTTAAYDDSRWSHAVRVTPPQGELVAQLIDPIKVTETLEPVNITEPQPGVYVFDVGRAVAGWALISVTGQPGTKITLKYGETLNHDGTVRAQNEHIHDGRFQIDEYILKGEGTEVWEPTFSYKGFRYVQVTGLQDPPTPETLKGRVVHSAVRHVGDFASSNELYNWIHTAMQHTLLNNLHGIPTDTPKYEKNGWTADAHLGALSMIYNFDMARFLSKWVEDIRDSQLASGQIPQIVPTSGWGLSPSPDWTTAYPIVVWALYEHYGDKRLMEDHYDALKDYVEWEIRRLNNGISTSVLGDWMAPWGGWNPPEDTRLAATVYVYNALTIMADIARVLGNAEDELRYATIAEEVKQAFNREFLNRDAGYYETQQDPNYRQTSNLLPLAFGMVPAEYEQAVIESIIKDIEGRDWHLNTGVLGTNVLLPVLTEYGYGDVAYAVSNQRTYPSWGLWYESGATSLWEEWGLNSRSQNHFFFGTIDHWFFQYVGGIKPAAPGFKRITIKPYIVGDLTHARATTETPYGQVTSGWELSEQGVLTFDVEIPVNATATVYVPFGRKWGVTEGRQVAHAADGVRYLGVEGDYAVYEVGSGSYRFTVHPASVTHLNALMAFFAERGAFTDDEAVHTLEELLTHISRAEANGEAAAIVERLSEFQTLLNAQYADGKVSEEAYQALEAEMFALMDGVFDAAIRAQLDVEYVYPRSTFPVRVELVNTGKVALKDVAFALHAPEGWFVASEPLAGSDVVQPGETVAAIFDVTVGREQPVGPIVLTAEAAFRRLDEMTTVTSTAAVNVAAPVRIQEVRSAPILSGESTMLWVVVENFAPHPVSGWIEVETPPGWSVVPAIDSYRLEAGERNFLTLTLNSPVDNVQRAALQVKAMYASERMSDQRTYEVVLANLALNKTVQSSSSVENQDWGAAKVVDGQLYSSSGSMGWSSNSNTGNNHTEWIVIDLGADYFIREVVLYPRSDGQDAGYGFPIDFTIQVSTDNQQWATVVRETDFPFPGANAQAFAFEPQEARYIKIEGTSLRSNPHDGNLYRMQFAEIRVN